MGKTEQNVDHPVSDENQENWEGPAADLLSQFLWPEIFEPEADILCYFLEPETDIMGQFLTFPYTDLVVWTPLLLFTPTQPI